MSELKQTELKKIAHLARLHPMQDVAKQCKDFNNLLHLFEEISAVDIEGIEPLAHPLDNMTQPLRDDKVIEEDQSKLFLTLTSATEAGVYLVPAAIADNNKING